MKKIKFKKNKYNRVNSVHNFFCVICERIINEKKKTDC